MKDPMHASAARGATRAADAASHSTEGLASLDASGPTALERRNGTPFVRHDAELPRLYAPAAKTISRDRWERIVSSHVIPAPAEKIWAALTDPAALRRWLFACHGSLEEEGRDTILDFEDGDFFLCRPIVVDAPHYLEWRWRWLGIGPSWTVKWILEPVAGGTRVTVVDEALNPPNRTGHYRGEGWPEILDILAAFVRTQTDYRWACRSQSYVLVDLDLTIYGAWDRLFNPAGLKWWLHGFQGAIAPGQSVEIHMGDASGTVELKIGQVMPPSYNTYPFVTFAMSRPFWPCDISGRLFLEPAGWQGAILQVYQTGWENLGPALQRQERSLIVGFWAEAFKRAIQVCEQPGLPGKASPWVLPDAPPTYPSLEEPVGLNGQGKMSVDRPSRN